MTSRVRYFGPTVLGVMTGLAVIVPVAIAARPSDAARACGAERNVVESEFDLPAAQEIWRHLPQLGITPELEIDTQPAHVVVFRGPFDPSGLVSPVNGVPPTLTNVICVVQSDGTVNLYFDVSRAGSRFAE